MLYIDKAIQTLEFDKVLAQLADCTTTDGSRAMALSLLPQDDPVVIMRNQRHTTDAKQLMALKGTPSFGLVSDIGDSVSRAQKGAVLTHRELLSCANVLKTARRLMNYLSGDRSFETSLDEIFGRLKADRGLEEKITRSIISEDMIADEASPALADIRRKMRIANSRIRDILQKYVSGGEYSKVLQENIVTQRGGRFVIPVKTEHKNEINGLIHDTSASGATVFIEPVAVVEANNELRILEGREQREIERILAELSANAADCGMTLLLDYQNITELAFIFACAELSYKQNAAQPKISSGDDREYTLIKARHPLIDKKQCVPISVTLGGRQHDTLIITGPNTGGKTVALKTLGLFALMTQAGLHIPASEESTVPVFESILADIGDEQSIEMSLSTFSSSMKNIIEILDRVSDRSLVLLDEIGAGTDPVEGAALAVAIIEDIRERHALCAATTHYAELKAYALNTEGICNAACEFDVETLRPTYKLIIGAPGKSNAFAISKRLGLSQSIVDRADELISGQNKDFENVIEKLEAQRVDMEREREEARRLRIEYERFKASAEEKLKQRLAGAEEEAERTRKRAADMLSGARASSAYVMEQLEKLKRQRDSENLGKAMTEAKQAIRERLRREDELIEPDIKSDDTDEYTPPRELKTGDYVLVAKTGLRGIITDGPDKSGNVTIKSNSITTRTKVDKLRLVTDEDTVTTGGKTAPVSSYKLKLSGPFRLELDIRGYTTEDGWLAVDKYLDEACVAGIKSVRIVHGKGTGALRAALHGFLRGDPRVSSFRIGAYGEGDAGVTVIELK